MVVVRICGGLGNQLFQYAMGRRLSLKRQAPLRLDTSFYSSRQNDEEIAGVRRELLLHEFNVQAGIASDEEIAATLRSRQHLTDRVIRRLEHYGWPFHRTRVVDRALNFRPSYLRLPGRVYLDGYWFSERYFQDVASTIREDFTFRDSNILNEARHYVDEVRRANEPVVAIHVRRGDVARAHQSGKPPQLAYPQVTVDYFRAALQRFDSRWTFLVFSDGEADLQWCRRNITAKFVSFASGNSTLQDFAIMQSCDHNIVSNSTFSWWAAWLNPNPSKRVVAPTRWVYLDQFPEFKLEDMVPATWEVVA